MKGGQILLPLNTKLLLLQLLLPPVMMALRDLSFFFAWRKRVSLSLS